MPSKVLVIGDRRSPDFSAAVDALEAGQRIAVVGDITTADDWLRRGSGAVRQVMLLQSWPGQWSAKEIGRLRQVAPLAEFAALLGPWCEGETRTGQPLPGVRRILLKEADIGRVLRELAVHGPSCPAPSTATEEDRALSNRVEAPRLQGLSVAVVSREAALAHLILDTVAIAGGAAWTIDPIRLPVASAGAAADAMVWDACEALSLAERRQEWAELVKRFRPAAAIGLHGFHRRHEAVEFQDEAAQHGTQLGWLAKPFSVAALVQRIAALSKNDVRTATIRPVRGPQFLRSRDARNPHTPASR